MKTSKENYKLFKNECNKWIKRFELNGWKIYYQHGGNNDNSYSTLKVQLNGRVATVYFTKEWEMTGVDNINESIKETAKHEMIHLLLGRFSNNADERFVTRDEIYEAEEELVRKLEIIIK